MQTTYSHLSRYKIVKNDFCHNFMYSDIQTTTLLIHLVTAIHILLIILLMRVIGSCAL